MIGKQLMTQHAIAAVELAMELGGGAGFYRAAGLERRFRDIQAARFHPLQAGSAGAICRAPWPSVCPSTRCSDLSGWPLGERHWLCAILLMHGHLGNYRSEIPKGTRAG